VPHPDQGSPLLRPVGEELIDHNRAVAAHVGHPVVPDNDEVVSIQGPRGVELLHEVTEGRVDLLDRRGHLRHARSLVVSNVVRLLKVERDKARPVLLRRPPEATRDVVDTVRIGLTAVEGGTDVGAAAPRTLLHVTAGPKVRDGVLPLSCKRLPYWLTKQPARVLVLV